MVVKVDARDSTTTINGKDFDKYPMEFRREIVSRLLHYCDELDLLNICQYIIVTTPVDKNNIHIKEV